MLKAVVFDFDGVIGDTYHLNFESVKLFDPTVTEQDFRDHHNGNVFADKPKAHLSNENRTAFFEEQKKRFSSKNFFPFFCNDAICVSAFFFLSATETYAGHLS